MKNISPLTCAGALHPLPSLICKLNILGDMHNRSGSLRVTLERSDPSWMPAVLASFKSPAIQRRVGFFSRVDPALKPVDMLDYTSGVRLRVSPFRPSVFLVRCHFAPYGLGPAVLMLPLPLVWRPPRLQLAQALKEANSYAHRQVERPHVLLAHGDPHQLPRRPDGLHRLRREARGLTPKQQPVVLLVADTLCSNGPLLATG
jgi:hypothetical protein